LLLQASWNDDRMIGVGSAWAIEPMLRALPGGRNGPRYRAAMARATQFFNAHPYLAGMAIGAVARAEHEDLPPETVRRLRHALVGPLGSVGDKLIWAGVMPTAVGIGLAVCALTSPIAGAITFLVLYNAVHLVTRWWALHAGWERGRDVSRALTARGLKRGLRIVGPLGALAVGFALPVVGEWLARDFSLRAQGNMVLVAGLAAAFAGWLIPRFRGLRFGLAAAAIALVVGWVW
jgi:PTS system mannose-specific IID component